MTLFSKMTIAGAVFAAVMSASDTTRAASLWTKDFVDCASVTGGCFYKAKPYNDIRVCLPKDAEFCRHHSSRFKRSHRF
jgi:hypothetical protein